MNKAKTRKSAAKRFRITATGKVLRRVSFGRHLRRNKSSAQKRRFRKTVQAFGPIAKKVKRMLIQA